MKKESQGRKRPTSFSVSGKFLKLVEIALTLSEKSPLAPPRRFSTRYKSHAESGRKVGPLSSAICFSFLISAFSFSSGVNVFFFIAFFGFLTTAFFLTAFLTGFLALGFAVFLVVDFVVELFDFVDFVVLDLGLGLDVVALAAGMRIDAEMLIMRTEGMARRNASARVARPADWCHEAAAPELVSTRRAAARPADDSILPDRLSIARRKCEGALDAAETQWHGGLCGPLSWESLRNSDRVFLSCLVLRSCWNGVEK